MGTTALIIEILVIGVQTSIALFLWALGFFGYGVVYKPLSLLKSTGVTWVGQTLIILSALAICYTLGILMDRIAVVVDRMVRSTLRWFLPKGFKRWVRGTTRRSMDADQEFVHVLFQENNLSSFLKDYQSRLRIARATMVNVLIVVLVLWFSPYLKGVLPFAFEQQRFVIGLAVLAITLFCWMLMHVTWEERARQVSGEESP